MGISNNQNPGVNTPGSPVSEIRNPKSQIRNALALAWHRQAAIFNDFGRMEAGWLA
jgi:hypothetical protein